MLFLFHLFQCLCSGVAAELCGAPSRRGQEGPRLSPAPVGTHPITPTDRGSLCLLYIADIPLRLILLLSVAVLWAVTLLLSFSFGHSKNWVGFPHRPHSEEFPGGFWSWDDLFGSKCTCFPKQTVLFLLRLGEEGLFPRCAELAPPSSKADKARSTSGGG